ncbi:MAG: hypothetical protein HOI95_04760 [Chromatiales bacterium]|nr:hypothetical protein [Chromatiales bacterium]
MTISKEMNENGVQIDLRAGFDSFSFLPTWLALGSNNINPSFRLFSEHMELKTTGRSKIKYVNLKLIDARTSYKTHNIIFYSQRSISRRAVNVRDQQRFLDVLNFFNEQGLKLSPKAHSYLT